MDTKALKRKFSALWPQLNERSRRLVAASEAQALGYGGTRVVAQITGLSERTLARGAQELAAKGSVTDPERCRKPGGGRKPMAVRDETLWRDLERLVEPVTRGDPESPLRWTCQSLRVLAHQLQVQGHVVSYPVVGQLLRKAGYALQANRKTTEGRKHPDRNAQFEFINRQVRRCLAADEPVVSVDTKKKELVGDFKNGGRAWRPQGKPERVRVHDFLLREKGKAIPYGVYDLNRNLGWVSIGIDHDTAAFAVHSLRRWWQSMGRRQYPQARRLLVTADAGGSNGTRSRLWKWELQRLANQTGLDITVCHFPPGTSKWNKIEHRLFSFISQNWRGRPLVNLAVIVSLITATRTKNGLRVRCEVDPRKYPLGVAVTKEQLATVRLRRAAFHGDWNYTILPQTPN
jgi:hypothetical protein